MLISVIEATSEKKIREKTAVMKIETRISTNEKPPARLSSRQLRLVGFSGIALVLRIVVTSLTQLGMPITCRPASVSKRG